MNHAYKSEAGRGFTLIELLIVIAILAVLATAVVLVLNPAELLAQARDAQRFSDLGAVESSLSLFIASVANPQLGTGIRCTAASTWNSGGAGSAACATVTTSTVVTGGTGGGWVDANLTQVPGGSPLGRLPMDPNNAVANCGGGTIPCFYGFRGDNTAKAFKLQTVLESTRYRITENRMAIDGGVSTSTYEVGSRLDL